MKIPDYNSMSWEFYELGFYELGFYEMGTNPRVKFDLIKTLFKIYLKKNLRFCRKSYLLSKILRSFLAIPLDFNEILKKHQMKLKGFE